MMLATAEWTTVGMFWVSVLLVIITLSATVINWRLFRSQIDPRVIVYAEADETRPSIILIVIENIGKGLAKNVSFTLSHQIPSEAYGW